MNQAMRSSTQIREELSNCEPMRLYEFLSSLALAEFAAADACKSLGIQLKTDFQNNELAEKYFHFATEEMDHYRLASGVSPVWKDPSKKALAVYQGALMSVNAAPIERMAVVHLVFEPAALAFLGFLKKNAELFDRVEPEVRTRIKNSFASILRDEVGHVAHGKTLVMEQLETSSEAEKRATKKSIRRHRAFLKVGLQSFFKENGIVPEFVNEMLRRFEFYFNRSMKGVAL